LPAARYELLLAEATGESSQWNRAGDAIYRSALNEADTTIRDFLMREAIACFDTVLQADKNNFQATLFKGLALADKRETMMHGVPLLLQAVRKDPDNIPANYTLALLAIESGQLDKALSRFQKLISLQPSNPEYYYQAGRVYEKSGMKDQALIHYRKSLELSKDEKTRELIRQTIDQIN
jgi:tetratricopeptide (TPR) repeat protein